MNRCYLIFQLSDFFSRSVAANFHMAAKSLDFSLYLSSVPRSRNHDTTNWRHLGLSASAGPLSQSQFYLLSKNFSIEKDYFNSEKYVRYTSFEPRKMQSSIDCLSDITCPFYIQNYVKISLELCHGIKSYIPIIRVTSTIFF